MRLVAQYHFPPKTNMYTLREKRDRTIVNPRVTTNMVYAAGRVQCGEIPGLPPLTAIAAGAEHALLSDGQRVYVIGRTIDPQGSVVVSAPWDAPVVRALLLCGILLSLMTACTLILHLAARHHPNAASFLCSSPGCNEVPSRMTIMQHLLFAEGAWDVQTKHDPQPGVCNGPVSV